MHYFIANWKANIDLKKADSWLDSFLSYASDFRDKCVVICPPFPLLIQLKEKIKMQKNIYLGSQDISRYESGNYTGEVTVSALQGLINFTLIGHSERRLNFQESPGDLSQKSLLAIKYGIQPIFCIRNENDQIPEKIKLLAYEPVEAIGTGSNQPPDQVLEIKKKLNLKPDVDFLYGGSVTEANASTYLKLSEIRGLLVGNESLNPHNFLGIVNSV